MIHAIVTIDYAPDDLENLCFPGVAVWRLDVNDVVLVDVQAPTDCPVEGGRHALQIVVATAVQPFVPFAAGAMPKRTQNTARTQRVSTGVEIVQVPAIETLFQTYSPPAWDFPSVIRSIVIIEQKTKMNIIRVR